MILHQPYGLEHPYEQNPEERFPRHPLAGEKFTIGIVTRPPQHYPQLQVKFCLNDQLPESVEALLQTDWQAQMEEGVGAEFLERLIRVEQDVWHAELTAPPQATP